jgi:single-stranded DNA-binding protein
MSDIARAVLVGRLTRDPDLNHTGTVLTLGTGGEPAREERATDWVDKVS